MRSPRHLEADGAPGDEPAFSGLRVPPGNVAAAAECLAAHLGIERTVDAPSAIPDGAHPPATTEPCDWEDRDEQVPLTEGITAALGDVLDRLDNLDRILERLPDDPLRLSALRSAVDLLRGDAGVAYEAALDADEAATILINGTPMAGYFPDGSAAPEEGITPRQVLYLADLATPERLRWEAEAPQRAAAAAARAAEAAEQSARHHQAVEEHKALHGMRPPRKCAQPTRSGPPCKSSALPFIDRPVCHNHAEDNERAKNSSARIAYESTYPAPDLIDREAPPPTRPDPPAGDL